MVSSAKRKLNESRHAYNKPQSLTKTNSSSKNSSQIPKEYLDMAANAPLHLAAMHGDLHGLKRILDQGYDINKLDTDKRTPLMLAALFGRIENVSHLLAHGASTIKKDAFGQKALHYAQTCKCNDKKRAESFGWHLLDTSNISLECRIIVGLLKGNEKLHICPSQVDNFADYFAVRTSKTTFKIMATVFEVTVNNADARTIAWTLKKGTFDVLKCSVSGWSFTKYKNPPDFLLDSEAWTDKVVILSNLVGHDLHGGNHDHGEYGRMFSSHAEKQLIAYLAWELVLEQLHSNSPRSWKKSRQPDAEPVQIFIDRIPCQWCEDLCNKTNMFLGMNIKLIWIHRYHPLADRCKCGGCMCDLPIPKVIVPMLEDIGIEDSLKLATSPKASICNQPKRKKSVARQLEIAEEALISVEKSSTIIGKSKTIAPMLPSFSTGTGYKARQKRIQKSFNPNEDTEDSETADEWIPIEPHSPPTKKTYQSQLATLMSEPATPSKASKTLALDFGGSDDEWRPGQSIPTKRKLFNTKGEGMSDQSHKKKCLGLSKKALTKTPHRQRLPISPGSSPNSTLNHFMYQEVSKSRAKATLSAANPKIMTPSPTPMKLSKSTVLASDTSPVVRKILKAKGRPRKTKSTSNAVSGLDELSWDRDF